MTGLARGTDRLQHRNFMKHRDIFELSKRILILIYISKRLIVNFVTNQEIETSDVTLCNQLPTIL